MKRDRHKIPFVKRDPDRGAPHWVCSACGEPVKIVVGGPYSGRAQHDHNAPPIEPEDKSKPPDRYLESARRPAESWRATWPIQRRENSTTQ